MSVVKAVGAVISFAARDFVRLVLVDVMILHAVHAVPVLYLVAIIPVDGIKINWPILCAVGGQETIKTPKCLPP